MVCQEEDERDEDKCDDHEQEEVGEKEELGDIHALLRDLAVTGSLHDEQKVDKQYAMDILELNFLFIGDMRCQRLARGLALAIGDMRCQSLARFTNDGRNRGFHQG